MWKSWEQNRDHECCHFGPNGLPGNVEKTGIGKGIKYITSQLFFCVCVLPWSKAKQYDSILGRSNLKQNSISVYMKPADQIWSKTVLLCINVNRNCNNMKPAGQSVCTVCAFSGQCASLLWSFSSMLVWLCVCAVVLPVGFWFVFCCFAGGGGGEGGEWACVFFFFFFFFFSFGVWGGGGRAASDYWLPWQWKAWSLIKHSVQCGKDFHQKQLQAFPGACSVMAVCFQYSNAGWGFVTHSQHLVWILIWLWGNSNVDVGVRHTLTVSCVLDINIGFGATVMLVLGQYWYWFWGNSNVGVGAILILALGQQ